MWTTGWLASYDALPQSAKAQTVCGKGSNAMGPSLVSRRLLLRCYCGATTSLLAGAGRTGTAAGASNGDLRNNFQKWLPAEKAV